MSMNFGQTQKRTAAAGNLSRARMKAHNGNGKPKRAGLLSYALPLLVGLGRTYGTLPRDSFAALQ